MPRERELERVARAVITRHCGRPVRVAPQGGGLSSEAFDATAGRERFIIRMGERHSKLGRFQREQLVVDAARAAGIPTGEIIAVGAEEDWAYSVAHRLPGEPASDHPKRMDVLRELGELAAIIHAIPTTGFGCDFEFDDDIRSAVRVRPLPRPHWTNFLYDELHVRARLDRFDEANVLPVQSLDALRATLAEIETWDSPPVLNHGDLRLKNVIVDAAGRIVGLIDWETAVSSIAMHWDMSVALHDLGIDAKRAFLDGYGMLEDEIRRVSHVWRFFNVLNYAPTLRELLADGDEREIDRLRTRLHGALDLHRA